MKKYVLLSFLLIILFLSSARAQGWEYILPDSGILSYAVDIIPTSDGNYLAGGFQSGRTSSEFGYYLHKLDEQGNLIWRKNYSANPGSFDNLLKLAGDRYLVTADYIQSTYSSPLLQIVDDNGTLLWEEEIVSSQNSGNYPPTGIALADGGFLVDIRVQNDVKLRRYDASYNLTSNDSVAFIGSLDQQLPNGNLIWLHKTSTEISIYETDVAGALLNTQTIPWTEDAKNLRYQNGSLFFTSTQATSGGSFVRLHQFDNTQTLVDTDTIWNGAYAGVRSMTALSDGWLINGFYGSNPDPTGGTGFAVRTDLNGNVLFTHRADHRPGPSSYVRGIPSQNDSGFLLAGFYDDPGSVSAGYVVKIDDNGILFNNIINGLVVADDLPDCVATADDTPVPAWFILATKNGDAPIIAAVTDTNGQYSTSLDTGFYTLSLRPANGLWDVCTNDILLDLTQPQQLVTQDFVAKKDILCPLMTVNSGVTLVVACDTQTYHIQYCNDGTITADDAYLEFTIDSAFTALSSSPAWTSNNNNLLIFDLGDVDPFQCGTIAVTVELSCQATAGYGYLSEVHIFPDTMCLPPDQMFSGALLESEGACTLDSVYFQIQNTGTQPMEMESNFFIVEDAVLMRNATIPILSPQQTFQYALPAEGATYTLLYEQVPNAPVGTLPIEIVHGCGGTGGIGLSNQFPMNDLESYLDIDYSEALSARPTGPVLMSSPTGYSDIGLIEPGTTIEYLIGFENTTAEPVNRIEIRDSLDEHLDLSSLQIGSSSHAFDWTVEDGRTLVFQIDNAGLASGARSFVSFSIRTRTDVPLGSEVFNQATIRLDEQTETQTEQSRHTLGTDFLKLIVGTTEQAGLQKTSVVVRPNPVVEEARIEVIDGQSERYRLEVYDAQGRKMLDQEFGKDEITVRRNDLPTGVFMYTLTAANGFRNSGVMIIQ